MRVIQPCPNCGSTDSRIRRVRGSANLLPLPGWSGLEQAGQFDLCVCAQRGFVGLFVPTDMLPTVRDTYRPVPPADSSGDAA